MAKVVASYEIGVAYEQWKTMFLANEETRNSAGIKSVYYGHELDNEQKLHVVLEAPSIEEFKQFMANNAEKMKEAGVKRETMVMAFCTD